MTWRRVELKVLRIIKFMRSLRLNPREREEFTWSPPLRGRGTTLRRCTRMGGRASVFRFRGAVGLGFKDLTGLEVPHFRASPTTKYDGGAVG
ncbi:hypothetical protein J1N35_029771 [Gossypium stocksii]|uniref:Uncharacterized protein n=1 Tax=Gossypium stocksii TaxID=47602 RepID=A0A9D3UZK2_9ROSI|nr:hypothetical protein J1N35_029771 [Gossypium stocksii]